MVPRTVGKRRRRLPGAVRPQHLRTRDAAARMSVSVRDECRDRPRPSHRVRVRDETYLPDVAAMPRFTFAAERERPRVLEHTDACGTSSIEPGTFAIDELSSTWSRAPGSDRSSSVACPCETTTAETFTRRVPRGRRRASSPRSPPGERPRPLETCPDEPLAVDERTADAVCEPLLVHEDRGVARDLHERGLARRDHGRATSHRLEHRQTEALEARWLHEARRAPVEVGEPLGLDVAHEPRAAPAKLVRERRLLLRPGDDERKADRVRRFERPSWFLRPWIAPTTRT